jgi:hypothetical protein
MAQGGRNDQSVTANSTTTTETSNGAPIGTYALVNGGSTSNITSVAVAHTPNGHFGNTSSGSRASVDAAMFGNTTINAFRQGQAIGVYGVDAAEMGVTTGSSNGIYRITSGGTGYGANAAVTINFSNSTSTYANVSAANSTVNNSTNAGRVTAMTANQTITGIIGQVSVAIAAPAAINITANSVGFSNTTDTIAVATANSKWQVGDRLFYGVPTSNTPIAPLAGNTYYYVSFANTTTIALSTTATGANIDITDVRTTATGEVHTIQGDTATGLLIPSGARRHAAHAGWVLRTEGTGGRAGRVQMETLVAMGSLGAQTAAYGTPATVADATDDNILHDS